MRPSSYGDFLSAISSIFDWNYGILEECILSSKFPMLLVSLDTISLYANQFFQVPSLSIEYNEGRLKSINKEFIVVNKISFLLEIRRIKQNKIFTFPNRTFQTRKESSSSKFNDQFPSSVPKWQFFKGRLEFTCRVDLFDCWTNLKWKIFI